MMRLRRVLGARATWMLLLIQAIGISDVTAAAAPRRVPAASAWRYSTSKDPFTDQIHAQAFVVSSNRVNLPFPYGGGSQARLIVRRTSDGAEILLQISRGQLLCVLDDCSIDYRIGDGEVNGVHADPADDDDPRVIFLNDWDGTFLKSLAGPNQKRLRISAAFFQAGNRTFEFLVDGLDMNKVK